jgi:hypothetical protein
MDNLSDPVRSLMQTTLECGVPLRIAEIQSRGGVTPCEMNSARELAIDLGSCGDKLLFGSKQKGEVASLMNRLIFAVAVGAFQPGGVTVFGVHFEA